MRSVGPWRRLASTVAVVAALLVTLTGVAAAENVQVGQCGSGGPKANASYSWTAVYQGGSVASCSYGGIGNWMTDVKNADIRGVNGTSNYASIYVRDNGSGMEVAAHYTSCSRQQIGNCPVTLSIVHQGDQAKELRSWVDVYNTGCAGKTSTINTSATREYQVWGAFLEQIGDVEHGKLRQTLIGVGGSGSRTDVTAGDSHC